MSYFSWNFIGLFHFCGLGVEMKNLQRSGQAHFIRVSSPDSAPPNRHLIFALCRTRVCPQMWACSQAIRPLDKLFNRTKFTCPNGKNIAHQTWEQKKLFKFLIEFFMAFQFYQTQSNSTKQGVQTVKGLVTKHFSFVQALRVFLFYVLYHRVYFFQKRSVFVPLSGGH